MLESLAIVLNIEQTHGIMTNNHGKEGPVKIDLQQVIHAKLGKKSRWVPRFLVRWLERTICQDKLNKLLEDNYPSKGADFCRGVFHDLDVTITARDEDNLPAVDQRRVIIVSNHPLGGLDGMALIDFFERRYGGRIYFLVNDLLMAVKPLDNVFLPVNKHGRQNRKALENIDSVLAGDDPVLIFPAGLCSRLQKGGAIRDLEWKKMFVVKAIQYHRDVVPVFFEGRNSMSFYKLARNRKRTGLKFNIEMVYLPREVFRSAGKTFTIYCGKTIPWQNLGSIGQASATAATIKSTVYNLAPRNTGN